MIWKKNQPVKRKLKVKSQSFQLLMLWTAWSLDVSYYLNYYCHSRFIAFFNCIHTSKLQHVKMKSSQKKDKIVQIPMTYNLFWGNNCHSRSCLSAKFKKNKDKKLNRWKKFILQCCSDCRQYILVNSWCRS